MKKILSSTLLLAAMAIAFTGCLKDKGFENGTYGINDPDTQPPGVGFPLGSNARITIGLDVSASAQVVNDLVFVNLESGTPASSDVHITLSDKTLEMVNAYNAANGTNIQVLPTNLWSVATSLTIPAGGRFVQVPLTVSNTTSLNPNLQYAIGLRITAVDGGYKIASNLDDLFIVIGIKNKYDGRYRLKGYHNRPTLTNPYDQIVNMETSGPNSVTMGWPANSSQYYSHPINGNSYYGSFTTNFMFNLTTNVMTGWDMYPWPNSLTFHISAPAPNGDVSRYDPATKIIYANFYYNSNLQRQFWDTLTYLGPR